MATLFTALRLLLAMTALTGVIYPLTMTGISQLLFKSKASGSPIARHNVVIGSRLIGQQFKDDRYFWPRPSAVDYNPLPSGGSNLAPTAKKLREYVDSRIKLFGTDAVPQDLLFASASGLDPHISPAAARFQLNRVANARKYSAEKKALLAKLVEKSIEHRQLAFLGEPRVNVLELNLKLDELTQ